MFKKSLYTFIFFATVIGAMGVVHNVAKAALGGRALDHGYFYNNNVAATCDSTGSNCTYGQVITGGFPNPASFDTSTNGNAGKTNFINFIEGKLNSGGRDGIGAAFIINTMIGLDGPGAGSTAASLSQINPATGNTYLQDWQNAVNQSAVTINYISYAYSVNSGYQKGYNDDAFFSEGGPHMAVVFFYNGTPVYALKDNCGNPVGSLPGIQIPTDPAPQGNVDNYCNTVYGWAFDKSVPTQAINVDIYINGSPWRRITANGSRPDVGAANPGVGNNHGFSVAWDTGTYPYTATYTVKVYAIGIDKNGNPNSDNPLIGQGTVGPSCTSGGGPVACPAQGNPNLAAIQVTLPPQTGNQTTVSSDGKTETVRYIDNYIVTSISDANNDSPKPTVPMPSPASSTSGTFNVDFRNLVQSYPYDTNAVTITYNTHYSSNTYPRLPDGSWSPTPNGTGPSGTWGPFTYTGTPGQPGSLGECYYRNFHVQAPSESPNTDITGNGVTLQTNYENPHTANISAQISVHFTLPSTPGNKPLRKGMSVNGLAFTGNYTIMRAGTASTVPLANSSRTLPQISCADTSADCMATIAFSDSVSVGVGNSANQLRPGDKVCATFTVTPQGTQSDENGTIVAATRSGAVTSTQQCSPVVINEPYFKVFGGDISAGDTFETTNGVATSCVASAAAASANVYGWNTAGDSGSYGANTFAGAGAQFSIMAINDINGVASDQNNPTASPGASNTQGNGLAFANAGTSPSSGTFARAFGASPSCIPDYYADKPSTTPGIGSSIPASANGSYSLSGGTLTGGTIGVGKHVVVYATGDVNVTGNITFAGGPYTSVNDIPSFVLVVKGNINIPNNVTQLDGIYIAQPTDPANPTDGTITDCAGASTATLFTSCNNQLVVNGSFIANKIDLLRTGTAGGSDPYQENPSLRGANKSETNFTSATMTVDAVAAYTCAGGGAPDGSGYCGSATYHPGGTSYGPWSGWSADTRGCGATSGSPQVNTSTTQYNNQYVSGICASGYRWQSRSVFTSSGYYSCPGGETVSGSRCKAQSTWTCPDGSVAPPSHKCTVNTIPTHASEIFNYNPAFWMTLSLQNASSQNAFKYDSITSLPPVL